MCLKNVFLRTIRREEVMLLFGWNITLFNDTCVFRNIIHSNECRGTKLNVNVFCTVHYVYTSM
jgi:hypothetical protein